MKKNSILWAVLPMMAAALMTTACSNEDSVAEAPAQQGGVKTIPYTVTVNGGAAQTRATVESDNKTLCFADGDKLYVTGTDIQGVLDIQAGDGTTTGPGTANATFSGDLIYLGEGSPADELALTATLVSAQQTVGTQVSVDAAGAVTVNYPATAFCSTVNDAVQQYSDLTGTATYGAKSFTLYQQTAFLNYTVKLKSSVAAGDAVTATVKNGATTLSTASVTTTTDAGSNVVACFVLPVAEGTVLSGATVTIGTLATVGFGGDAAKTLEGKVYNVARSIVDLASCSDSYAAQNGDYITYSGAYNFYGHVSVPDGATVTLGGAEIVSYSSDYAAIHCLGDANIVLADGTTNTVESYEHAGIFVPEYSTLTISGAGSLSATGHEGAVIGARYNGINYTFIPCGNITIKGGNITALGNSHCAGIGGGCQTSCGDISIEGGTIIATGDNDAAGIGSGYFGSCGKISITGGTVTATGGSDAAGIGSGYSGSCGDITIGSDVTKVIATKDGDADAPIGKGSYATCGTVTIDGTTTWTAGTPTTHYSWDVSNEGKTWTLTKKNP